MYWSERAHLCSMEIKSHQVRTSGASDNRPHREPVIAAADVTATLSSRPPIFFAHPFTRGCHPGHRSHRESVIPATDLLWTTKLDPGSPRVKSFSSCGLSGCLKLWEIPYQRSKPTVFNGRDDSRCRVKCSVASQSWRSRIKLRSSRKIDGRDDSCRGVDNLG
jgi:hypothetical protein